MLMTMALPDLTLKNIQKPTKTPLITMRYGRFHGDALISRQNKS